MSGGTVNVTPNNLLLGHSTAGDGTVTISSGTINVAVWLYLCIGTNGRAALNMTGGTINCNNGLLAAHDNGSIGTINISGTSALLAKNTTAGTIRLASNGNPGTTGGQITMNVSGGTVETANFLVATTSRVGASAIVNLTGGNINCNSLVMGTTAGVTAKINVAGGTLRINGDQRTNLQPYITAGKIVAYNSHPRATLNVVYDSVNNKTVVTATLPNLFQAYNPSPTNGATGVAYNGVTLSWSAGDDAVSHDVYFGDDSDAVANATVATTGIFLGNQAGTTKAVGDLELDKTYYWRIDERTAANVVTAGDVWSFTISSNLIVDDMVTYDGGNPISTTWAAGGATVSLDEAFYYWVYPKSLRLDYNNAAAPYYSQATRTFATDQNWAASNIKAFQLVFHGAPANTNEPVYVVIEDADGDKQTIFYDQTDDTIIQASYRPWLYFDIDLTSLNAAIDVTRIKKLTVGVGNPITPAAGGVGTVWFDYMALYPSRCISAWTPGDTNGDCKIELVDLMVMVNDWLKQTEIVTPVTPTSGLVARYTFDETFGTDVADSSGNNYTAEASSSSGWNAGGKFGGCIVFDGSTVNYVDVPQATATTMFTGIDKEFTVSLWLWGTEQTPYRNSMMEARGPGLTRPILSHCPWENGVVYFDSGDTTDNRTSFSAAENQFYGQWNHYAYVKNANEGWMRIYVNGELMAQKLNTATKGIAGVNRFTLGNNPGYTAPWKGKMDEFRLYNRALTQAEIVALADKTSVTQPLVTPAEIVKDGIVNLKDAAEVFSNWLAEVLWP